MEFNNIFAHLEELEVQKYRPSFPYWIPGGNGVHLLCLRVSLIVINNYREMNIC